MFGNIDAVMRSGIQIIAILMGDEVDITKYNCLDDIHVYDSYTSLPNLYFSPDCYGLETPGPYNGLYTYLGDVRLNQKVFVGPNNYEASFNGYQWEFTSSSQGDKLEMEVLYSLTPNRPPHNSNWTMDG